jgi:integrase
MASRAWTFQRKNHVEKFGTDKAPWYCGWYEPDGTRKARSFGTGVRGKDQAERFRVKMEDDLASGKSHEQTRKGWDDFVVEYDERRLAGLAPRSRPQALTSLRHFARIVEPKRVQLLTTRDVDKFIAARRLEPGDKKQSTLSPASLNHDLRHIKAALKAAHDWGYLPQMPKVQMAKQPRKLVRYMLDEDFAAIYAKCDEARMPKDQPYPAGDWWRGLLTLAFMSGWRISEILALRREDVNLDEGVAVLRAENTKGKRDERINLHPVVVEHLRKLPGFDSHVFPWNHNPRTLSSEFHRIQRKAGINLLCRGEHEHTPACHCYGFHDCRRAFGTINATRMTPDALQALMRHESYQTTQVYINYARQLDAAVAGLHVPEVLRVKAGG